MDKLTIWKECTCEEPIVDMLFPHKNKWRPYAREAIKTKQQIRVIIYDYEGEHEEEYNIMEYTDWECMYCGRVNNES